MNNLGSKFIAIIVAGVAIALILMLLGFKPGIFVGLAIIGVGGAFVAKEQEDNRSSSYGAGVSQEHSRYNKTRQNLSADTENVATTVDSESIEDNNMEEAPHSLKDEITKGIFGAVSDFAHSEKGMENEKRYYERRNSRRKF
jgi:hypothetical protein